MSLPTHRKAGRSAVFDISRPDDGEDPKVKRGGLFGRLASAQPLLAAALVTLLLFGLYRQFSAPVVAAPHGHDRTVPAPLPVPTRRLSIAPPPSTRSRLRGRGRVAAPSAAPSAALTARPRRVPHELYARHTAGLLAELRGSADGVRQIVRIARSGGGAAAAVAPIDDARDREDANAALAAAADGDDGVPLHEYTAVTGYLRAKRDELRAVGARRRADWNDRSRGGRAEGEGGCNDERALAAAAAERPHALRVVSANLWNLERSWPARFDAIAELMQRLKPDILFLQEVRPLPGADARGERHSIAAGAANPSEQARSELDELIERIRARARDGDDDLARTALWAPAAGPGAPAGAVSPPNGWTQEGVALLSRFDLVGARDSPERARAARSLPIAPTPRSSDICPRALLAATLNATLPSGVAAPLTTFVAHVSYDSDESCRMMEVVRREVDTRWGEDPAGDRNDANGRRGGLGQLLAGDVNAYLDFEWAVDTLTRRDDAFTSDARLNPCAAALGSHPPRRDASASGGELGGPPLFVDAWEALHRPEPGSETPTGGYTFPNPQTRPNDPSRPDRILARAPPLSGGRAGLRPLRAAILGCDPIGRDEQGPLYMSDHRFLVADFDCATPGCGVGLG